MYKDEHLKGNFFFISSKELNEEPRVRETLHTKNILKNDENNNKKVLIQIEKEIINQPEK